jgi:hypothetical protein
VGRVRRGRRLAPPHRLRLDRGLLRAQAEALAPDAISDHELLYRNRSLLLVRYAHTGAGAVWVHGELPPELVTRSGWTACSARSSMP